MMQKPSTRDKLVIGLVLILLILIAAAVVIGLVVIALWAVRGLQHLDVVGIRNAGLNVAYLFTDVGEHNVRRFSVDKLSVLLTAIATVWLAVATIQLRSASRRQVAADAPLLEINLYLPPGGERPALQKVKIEEYIDQLNSEDEQHFGSAQLSPPRHIYLEVRNVQDEPFAPARDIQVEVYLSSEDLPKTVHDPHTEGLPADIAREIPRRMVRSMKIPVLGANCAELHPIFNVAPLSALECGVRRVLYYDLKGRGARSAAYGEIKLNLTKGGTVSTEGGYSEPAKWEMP